MLQVLEKASTTAKRTEQATQKNAVLGTGYLQRTGEKYALVLLSGQNIDQILNLRHVALTSLAEGEKSYLAGNKDRQFYEKHFAENNEVIGIMIGNRLIAQASILYPTIANPNTGIGLQLNVQLEDMAVLQGAIVDPEYRGNSLQRVLINARLAQASKRGRLDVFCQVSLGNTASLAGLLHEGMHIENISVSLHTGADVYVMHSHVSSTMTGFCTEFDELTLEVARSDIRRQKELFSDGYKATAMDRAAKIITLQKVLGCTPQL